MRSGMVWVILRKEDPYLRGGVPHGVYRSERVAFDALAELVALAAWDRWQHEKRTGSRMSRDDATHDELAGFGIGTTWLHGDEPHESWWSKQQDRLARQGA